MDSAANQRQAQEILTALGKLISKAVNENDDLSIMFIMRSMELIAGATERLVEEMEKNAGNA
jgi:hypothetical protein